MILIRSNPFLQHVQAKEFEDCPSINVSSLSLIEHEVLVIWKWPWTEYELEETMSDCDEDNDSITVIPETLPSSEDVDMDAERDAFETETLDTVTQHTVTFKCIGCTKQQNYQEVLASVAQIRRQGGNVDVRLEPEPTNPVYALKLLHFSAN